MKDLVGKVAVITGGASGIGYATARALAREGMRLMLADTEERILSVAVATLANDGAKVMGLRTDVGRKASVEALADLAWSEYGRVDIVFNKANVVVAESTRLANHMDWERSMRVEVLGPIHDVEVFVPRLIAQAEGGHMLFTGSFAGLVRNLDLGPYSLSKFAVMGLVECLHQELKEHDIGVSVLMPERVNASMSGSELSTESKAALLVHAIRHSDLYVHAHSEAIKYPQIRSNARGATLRAKRW